MDAVLKYKSFRLFVLVWLVVCLSLPIQAQDIPILTFDAPVDGRIDAGTTRQWQFTSNASAMLSFQTSITGGDLDTILIIQNDNGEPIFQVDDPFPFSDSNARIEAFTAPYTGTYYIEVAGYGETSGTFQLRMLPGYLTVQSQDNFDSNRGWEVQTNDDLTQLSVSNGSLVLELEGVREVGIANSADSEPLADFYVETNVQSVSGRNGWTTGIAFRQQDADTFYLLAFSNQGFWRLELYQDGEMTIIRDWSSHPGIFPEATQFSLGMLANGSDFEFFYNNQSIGSITDTMIGDAGTIGLAVITTNAIGSQTIVIYDDIIVSTPQIVDNETLFPQQVIISNPNSMIQALKRQNLIPNGGEMVFMLPQSSFQDVEAGVSQFGIGNDRAVTNFALGTTVSWEIVGDLTSGCGITFRQVDQSHYSMVYFDSDGGFGMTQRDGDHYTDDFYGRGDNPDAESVHLLIVADDDWVHLYVDGQHHRSIENSALSGTLGNAVVNFEPIYTICQFNDTWLWTWDE